MDQLQQTGDQVSVGRKVFSGWFEAKKGWRWFVSQQSHSVVSLRVRRKCVFTKTMGSYTNA